MDERAMNSFNDISGIATVLPFHMEFAVATCCIFMIMIMIIIGRGKRRKNWKNAPPGPVGWPILGSLPKLSGRRLHEEFFELAKIYGPLFSIKLGMKTAIVVSSPDLAEEVLKIKESSICSRNITETIRVVSYDIKALTFTPYSHPLWKPLRRLCVEELFSPKAFQSLEPLRTEQVHKLLKQLYPIAKTRGEVSFAESAFVAMSNMISNILVSKSLFDSTDPQGVELKDIFWELINVLAIPNAADLIPLLRPFDPQGLKKRISTAWNKLDRFYEKLVEDRLKERDENGANTGGAAGRKDFLDALLDYRSDDKENHLERFHKETVKGMISEMFIAGTETSSSTIEWGMTEILRKPHVYQEIVSELDQVIGNKRFVEESDIPKLTYFQAAVKEVFRLHPGVPLIIPRRADEDCHVGGYRVPKDCIVYVNIWGIGRDSKVWEDPYEFRPERFIGSSVDVKGQDFNLLPFGSGRRSCVGWPLAHRNVHFFLAGFLHAYEWECGDDEMLNDMNEKFGLTVQKDKRLLATPKPRLPISVYA